MVTVAEFGQFVARMDERFEHVNRRFASLEAGMDEFRAEIRAEMRSQRVLVTVLHGPLAVGSALAIVGVAAKFVFS